MTSWKQIKNKYLTTHWKKISQVVPSNKPILWTDKHQRALEQLIDCLLYPPVLGFLDFTQPFVVSIVTLTAAEKNYHYHVGKQEFLALKLAITFKFHLSVIVSSIFLYYAPTFTVYSNNNPLTYILSTAKRTTTTSRWVTKLADFHFTIKYRQGRENSDSDALSRMPLDVVTDERMFWGASTWHHCRHDTSSWGTERVHCNLVTFGCIYVISVEGETNTESISSIPKDQIREAQESEPVISPVLDCKLSGSKPLVREQKESSPKTKCLF